MKAHKQTGGQLNDVFMERTVVDWVLPHPIACREIIAKITNIYIEGDEENNLKQHRFVKFFDPACRAANYQNSKVIDRLRQEKSSFLSFLS